jgi:hypothetical protein
MVSLAPRFLLASGGGAFSGRRSSICKAMAWNAVCGSTWKQLSGGSSRRSTKSRKSETNTGVGKQKILESVGGEGVVNQKRIVVLVPFLGLTELGVRSSRSFDLPPYAVDDLSLIFLEVKNFPADLA